MLDDLPTRDQVKGTINENDELSQMVEKLRGQDDNKEQGMRQILSITSVIRVPLCTGHKDLASRTFRY